jgi:hypothetical protein
MSLSALASAGGHPKDQSPATLCSEIGVPFIRLTPHGADLEEAGSSANSGGAGAPANDEVISEMIAAGVARLAVLQGEAGSEYVVEEIYRAMRLVSCRVADKGEGTAPKPSQISRDRTSEL